MMHAKLSLAALVLMTLNAGAPGQVLFEDTFDGRLGDGRLGDGKLGDGKLGDGWTWLRENADDWRIKDGALEIRVRPGKADTVQNALVRKAPNRAESSFAVEVTVTFIAQPTEQYEQGGITWYHNQKPVFKLVHEHIDGADWIIPGRKPAASKTVQLRLEVRGKQWTAQFREDQAAEYQTAATGELPPAGDDQISIQCYEGPAAAEHWIRFDDFRIVGTE